MLDTLFVEALRRQICRLALCQLLALGVRPRERLTCVGEYDFQMDIRALITRARDGHFVFNGDATQIFFFERQISLVSISSDGFALPQVYIFGKQFLFWRAPLDLFLPSEIPEVVNKSTHPALPGLLAHWAGTLELWRQPCLDHTKFPFFTRFFRRQY